MFGLALVFLFLPLTGDGLPPPAALQQVLGSAIANAAGQAGHTIVFECVPASPNDLQVVADCTTKGALATSGS